MSNANQGLNPRSVVKGVELQGDTLLLGLETKLPSTVTTLLMRGVSTPVADVVKEGQDLMQPYKNKRDANTVSHQFSLDKPQIEKDLRKFIADVKAALVAVTGGDNAMLTSFGFKPKKPAKSLTAEQQLLRSEKAKQTRQKRGTLGSRQKAAIKATDTPHLNVTFGPTPESSPPSTQAPTGTKP